MKMSSMLGALPGSDEWKRSARNAACLAAFTLGLTLLAAAQQAAQPNPAPTSAAQASSAPAQPDPAAAPADASADASTSSTPQTPQQKQLADDTAKLLSLANELKTELEKSNKDMLSLSVIKKADQVEKLAHKVRDEMKAGLSN